MQKQTLENPLFIPLRPPPLPPNLLFPHLWLNHEALAASKCTTTSERFPIPIGYGTPDDQHFHQTLRLKPADDGAHSYRTPVRTPSPVSTKVTTANPALVSKPKYAEDQTGKGKRQKIKRTESPSLPAAPPSTDSRTVVAPDLLETISPSKRYLMEAEKVQLTHKDISRRESGSEKSPESGVDDFEDESDTRPSSTSRGGEQNIECVVCGDKSSGKHYGQHTCEGCKSFFKRSVRRKLIYKCRGNRQCPVDMHHRNQCQHCRFQKCLKTGMRKEAVQQGRLPSFGSQYYSGFFGFGLGGLMGPGSLMSSTPIQPNPSHTQLISQLLRAEPILHNELFRADLHDIKASLIQYMTSLEENSAHTRLVDPKSPKETRTEERCTRFLMNHVDWARQTPFFANLCTHDQISLLKSAWPEIFLLSLAQVGPLGLSVERSHPLTPVPRQTSIKHPNNSDPNSSTMKQDIDASRAFSQSGLCPFPGAFVKPTEAQQTSDTQRTDGDHRYSQMRLLCESIGCIANLQLDAVECVCLKSLLLFNPDAPGLIDAFNIDCTQTKIQGAFEEYLRYQLPHQSPLRFGHILLRLHGLRWVSKEVYEELLLPAKLRRASIDTFLETILRNELPSTKEKSSPDFPYNTPIKGIDPHLQLRVPAPVPAEVGPPPLPMFAEKNPGTTSLTQDPSSCSSEQMGYMQTYLNPPPFLVSRTERSPTGEPRPSSSRFNQFPENLIKSPSLGRGNIPTSSDFDSAADHSAEQLKDHIRRIMDQNLPSGPFSDFSTYLRSLSFERGLPNFHRASCLPPTEDSRSRQWHLPERYRMVTAPLLANGKLTPDLCTAAVAAAYTHSVSSLIGCGASRPKAQMVSRTEPKRP